MIRLLGVELTRLRWRRAVIALLIACFVIPGLIFAGTVWDSRPYSQAEIDNSVAQIQSEPWFQKELTRCERHPDRFGKQDAAACATEMPMEYAGLYREPLSVRGQLRGTAPGVVTVLAVVAMLLGATFAGADWTSGSMSNQLLFEPRRARVWLAKAGAVALALAAVGFVVQLLYWLGIYSVAGLRDIATPAELMTDVRWMVVRGTFLVALAAVAGYAVTMLFRSTVVTLGLLFAVAVAGTFIVAALPLNGQNERWMVHTNANAVIQGVSHYYRETPEDCYGNRGRPQRQEGETRREWRERCDSMADVTVWQGLRYLGAPFLLAGGLSLWQFRRRDIP